MPLAARRVDLVPEVAARLGVDAGGRLVEQQQLRLVQQAGGKRQPLLPAAGKLAGELFRAIRQSQPSSAASTRGFRSSIPYIRATKRRFSRIVRSSQSEKRCVM